MRLNDTSCHQPRKRKGKFPNLEHCAQSDFIQTVEKTSNHQEALTGLSQAPWVLSKQAERLMEVKVEELGAQMSLLRVAAKGLPNALL